MYRVINVTNGFVTQTRPRLVSHRNYELPPVGQFLFTYKAVTKGLCTFAVV